jgi:hypothetical protein
VKQTFEHIYLAVYSAKQYKVTKKPRKFLTLSSAKRKAKLELWT